VGMQSDRACLTCHLCLSALCMGTKLPGAPLAFTAQMSAPKVCLRASREICCAERRTTQNTKWLVYAPTAQWQNMQAYTATGVLG
jgi:hypothetical protein